MTAITARVSRAAEEATTADELWIMDVDGAIVIIYATYRPDTPAELTEMPPSPS